ncbi:hypothetical protein B4Q13_19590, partial [Lacticaseibacillus rhamnosus]
RFTRSGMSCCWPSPSVRLNRHGRGWQGPYLKPEDPPPRDRLQPPPRDPLPPIPRFGPGPGDLESIPIPKVPVDPTPPPVAQGQIDSAEAPLIRVHPDTGRKQILANAKVSLLDEKGELMQDFVTGNDGKFLFRVYENENYNMVGESDGYLVKRQLYTTRGRSVDPAGLKDLVTNITFDTLLVLDKIELNKIFVLTNLASWLIQLVVTGRVCNHMITST